MPSEQFDERELLSESCFHQFVPVVFADSPIEAEHYRSLLEDRNIPAIVQEALPTCSQSASSVWDVPVLVPDELLNDASEVISSTAAPDDDGDGGCDGDDDYIEQEEQQDDLDEDEDDHYGLDEDFDDDEADEYEDDEDLFDQDESDYE
ncbi:MAG TPA: DUF2007 domain-containing protein [Phycisphaerae bacterium]|nr:DUF2007 domain-containing protein [Phycisphaerae bacterium]